MAIVARFYPWMPIEETGDIHGPLAIVCPECGLRTFGKTRQAVTTRFHAHYDAMHLTDPED